MTISLQSFQKMFQIEKFNVRNRKQPISYLNANITVGPISVPLIFQQFCRIFFINAPTLTNNCNFYGEKRMQICQSGIKTPKFLLFVQISSKEQYFWSLMNSNDPLGIYWNKYGNCLIKRVVIVALIFQ